MAQVSPSRLGVPESEMLSLLDWGEPSSDVTPLPTGQEVVCAGLCLPPRIGASQGGMSLPSNQAGLSVLRGQCPLSHADWDSRNWMELEYLEGEVETQGGAGTC